MREFFRQVAETRQDCSLQHDLLKCMEELGEVVSAVVKEEGKDRLAEELGDLVFCVCCVIDDVGLTLEDVLIPALNKVRKRTL